MNVFNDPSLQPQLLDHDDDDDGCLLKQLQPTHLQLLHLQLHQHRHLLFMQEVEPTSL